MPAGAIALAGVIGGMDSAISEKTTRVVLESANFQASSHPQDLVGHQAADRCLHAVREGAGSGRIPCAASRGPSRLLQEVSPGIRTVGGVADRKREIPAAAADRPAARLAGAQTGAARSTAAEVSGILERLEFGVAEPAQACSR